MTTRTLNPLGLNAAQWAAINDLTLTGNGGHEPFTVTARYPDGAVAIVIDAFDDIDVIVGADGSYDE